jgi:hypothetical protein
MKPRVAKYVLLAVALSIAMYYTMPFLLFDTSKPAYDAHSEFRDGKYTAWGPRPRHWLLFYEPGRSTFRGNEWYFRMYRSYSKRWVEKNGFVTPDWPKYD